MIRLSTIAIGMSLGLNLVASNATAQWGYPMGYGGYGMSRWGQDPPLVTWLVSARLHEARVPIS